jgi:hypothetical protein
VDQAAATQALAALTVGLLLGGKQGSARATADKAQSGGNEPEKAAKQTAAKKAPAKAAKKTQKAPAKKAQAKKEAPAKKVPNRKPPATKAPDKKPVAKKAPPKKAEPPAKNVRKRRPSEYQNLRHQKAKNANNARPENTRSSPIVRG